MKQHYAKVKRDILEYFFGRYKSDGEIKRYNLSEIIFMHGFSLTEVGNFLIQNHLVKGELFRPREFSACISDKGIKEIESTTRV